MESNGDAGVQASRVHETRMAGLHQRRQVISQTPYQQSGLATTAPINDYQNAAMQLAYDRALYGAPDLNAARCGHASVAGKLCQPVGAERRRHCLGAGVQPGAGGLLQHGAVRSESVHVGRLRAGQDRAPSQYDGAGFASGTAAQNDAAAAMAGAFGGSGYQQKQAADAAGLAQQIGNMASGELSAQQQYAGTCTTRTTRTRCRRSAATLARTTRTWRTNCKANASGRDVELGRGNILSGAGLAGGLSQQDFKRSRA